MDKSEYDMLIAILKQLAQHFAEALLEKGRNAARRAWEAIVQTATAALKWIRDAWKAASEHAHDFLQAAKRVLSGIIARVKTMIADFDKAPA
jgi:hypothetical protein